MEEAILLAPECVRFSGRVSKATGQCLGLSLKVGVAELPSLRWRCDHLVHQPSLERLVASRFIPLPSCSLSYESLRLTRGV